jgi:hypothetical protein
VTKDHLLIALTPLPKEIAGSFAERLQQARMVAVVQLGGERLLQRLQAGELTLSPQLSRFWVFMPDPAMYDHLAMGPWYLSTDDLRQQLTAWTDYLQHLRERTPRAQLKLGLYPVPPFWGGSFLDWERPGGAIHISPYVWNRAPHACPGYDLHWLGNTPSEVYEAYVGALDWLHHHAPNILPGANA